MQETKILGLRSMVALAGAVMLLAVSATEAAGPAPIFVKVSATGTWLRVDTTRPASEGGPDQAGAPTSVTLQKLGVKAGDMIALQTVGEYNFDLGKGQTGNNLLGVFRKGRTLVRPGKAKRPSSAVTEPTCPRGLPTDVPEDFSVPTNGWLVVQVPPEADNIAFGAGDCHWKDNSDPDHDFGVNIEKR